MTITVYLVKKKELYLHIDPYTCYWGTREQATKFDSLLILEKSCQDFFVNDFKIICEKVELLPFNK
ncbi:hypothetical protein LC087_02030 [Bacillus carboniphilus]|uniref:Uncharacterized protein n=1 Tax=Bacillus carboniphilus TaxID=86663 RepID=A0ABY9JZF5_9BACI|nr:hypothetical protein [Bacillus carboniphilus]WLR43021.1 hypothetical protein LC087_02030 [Bacillus carboniphilus]